MVVDAAEAVGEGVADKLKGSTAIAKLIEPNSVTAAATAAAEAASAEAVKVRQSRRLDDQHKYYDHNVFHILYVLISVRVNGIRTDNSRSHSV